MNETELKQRIVALNPALVLDVRNWLADISVEAHDIEIDEIVTTIEQRVLAGMTGPLPE